MFDHFFFVASDLRYVSTLTFKTKPIFRFVFSGVESVTTSPT